MEQLSREELLALVVAQAQMIEQLTARVVELERQLGRHSRNSSTPPSQDGLGKPPPRSMRGKSGRGPGKQPGMPGSGLSRVAVADHVKRYFPASCGRCSAALDQAAVAGEAVCRQVFDLPDVRVEVTEHRMFALRCACATVTRAAAPTGVSAPTQYGPRLTATAAYLSAQHHVPTARITQILTDLAGVDVSTGWVVQACLRTEKAIAGANTAIRDALAGSPVVYFDESVTRIAGRNHWLHTAATATLTAYHVDEHGRSGASITAFGILPRFTGVAVHDAYSAYDTYTACTHALCNAHIVREAAGINEFDPVAQADGWPAHFITLLGDAHRWTTHWAAQGHQRLPDFKLDDLHRRYDRLVEQALLLHPRRPGKQSPATNLALRLHGRRDEFLRFASDFRIGFSNNTAEQAIRMIKTKTKVSGGFRTLTGAQTFLALRGYISTARKNGADILTALRDALTGTPWLPAIPTTT